MKKKANREKEKYDINQQIKIWMPKKLLRERGPNKMKK